LLRVSYSRRVLLFRNRRCVTLGSAGCADELVPYLGGVASCVVLLVVGLVQFGLTSSAFLPAGLFLVLNIIESQLITPAVLGRSMQLNPLIIIIWIAITGWLWGVVGVLLAVPILMCFKIILENLGVFDHWIRLLESK
jgi:predicted PurR-regulated permease PerM